jgi:riboflavin synthase
MFTGIVQQVCPVVALELRGEDARLRVDLGPQPQSGSIDPGASVAINGVCLTLTDWEEAVASFDVSRESLAVTTLGRLARGARVNIETALTLDRPLGGHLVSGHVDGIGEVVAIEGDARSTRMTFRLPAALLRYVSRKGSLSVDGVSLTVNEVVDRDAFVNVVPHTLAGTIMGDYEIGTPVNIEVDLIARYLERLLETRAGG